MNKPLKLIETKHGQTSGISSQSSDGFVSSIAEEILNSPLIVAPFTTPPAPSCSLCRSEFTGVNLVRRRRRRVRRWCSQRFGRFEIELSAVQNFEPIVVSISKSLKIIFRNFFGIFRAPKDASRATRAAAGRVAAGNRFNRFSTGSDRFQLVRTGLTGLNWFDRYCWLDTLVRALGGSTYLLKSSRFGRLQGIKCAIAGKNLYMRFTCSTGDAIGMNMVSKGVQNVLDFLQTDFPDMDVIGISGNFCSDKKLAAVNWIEGLGKSVVCKAIIPGDVVRKVLKTSVESLVELNMLKNLIGSAMAGALGGFNAHAGNIVSAVYIATGQDPAQNIESSHCITMMEAVNDCKDLHVSVIMPSIECLIIRIPPMIHPLGFGGRTQLASQSACLNLLGVKGASKEMPGANSKCT
ncbi:3-hydroxy-3-methylglutaryl-coenzyme A reductase 1 [Hibiscus syriacus]|uniref:hydroxymethylglutaryl-CoA reductase (NADPH) n=1 Tax=Hibiscus syriacus TaxID=106335 RepID=A0A6A3BDP5_HIBSY|nr:3-hydroxy-3-methylglutaryl-coenzyme A reductase 1 [Hibiscus syriacus]